jgi:hypothetical protein
MRPYSMLISVGLAFTCAVAGLAPPTLLAADTSPRELLIVETSPNGTNTWWQHTWGGEPDLRSATRANSHTAIPSISTGKSWLQKTWTPPIYDECLKNCGSDNIRRHPGIKP